jgi:hypothetical protein
MLRNILENAAQHFNQMPSNFCRLVFLVVFDPQNRAKSSRSETFTTHIADITKTLIQ